MRTLDFSHWDSLWHPQAQGPFSPWLQFPAPHPPLGPLASWSQPGWFSVTTSQLRRHLLRGLRHQHIFGGHSSTYPSHPPIALFTDKKTEDQRNLLKTTHPASGTAYIWVRPIWRESLLSHEAHAFWDITWNWVIPGFPGGPSGKEPAWPVQEM